MNFSLREVLSFDLGPVHFIAFSTEFYFFTNYGETQISNQFRWLMQDLEVPSKTSDSMAESSEGEGEPTKRAVDRHHGTQTHVLLRF